MGLRPRLTSASPRNSRSSFRLAGKDLSQLWFKTHMYIRKYYDHYSYQPKKVKLPFHMLTNLLKVESPWHSNWNHSSLARFWFSSWLFWFTTLCGPWFSHLLIKRTLNGTISSKSKRLRFWIWMMNSAEDQICNEGFTEPLLENEALQNPASLWRDFTSFLCGGVSLPGCPVFILGLLVHFPGAYPPPAFQEAMHRSASLSPHVWRWLNRIDSLGVHRI